MNIKIAAKGVVRLMVVIMVFMQFSCRTYYPIGETRARAISDKHLYSSIIDSGLHYNSFYVKRFAANVTLEGKKKSFKGSLKNQKDSAIWISVRSAVGGIEGMRILITPDSVKVIDRMKKEYFYTTFDFINEQLNTELNFESLQAIFTNSLFQAISNEKNRPFVRNFKNKVIDNQYHFGSKNPKKVVRKLRRDKVTRRLNRFGYQRFIIDPSLKRIIDVLIMDFADNRNINLTYRDFKMYDNQKFPQRMSLKVTDDRSMLLCNIKFNKITFNEKLHFSFKISRKYKQVYP